MPKPRTLIAAAAVAAAIVLAACGGDEGPDPSIPPDAAETLLADLQEIQDNIDVDSCLAAGTRVDNLISDIQALPPDVDPELKRNLQASAERLQTLLNENNDSDPACTDDSGAETTTEETTTDAPTTTDEHPATDDTTTKETTTEPPTTQTTTTPPTTTPPPPNGGGSGGIGPGGGVSP